MASFDDNSDLNPSQLDNDPDVEMAGIQTQANASSSTTMEGDMENSFAEDTGGDGQEDSQEQNASAEQAPAENPTAMDINMEEGRMPLRKDVSLKELISKMDDYQPVIPDAVIFHALTLAGLKPPPLSSLTPSTSSTTNPNTTNGGPISSNPPANGNPPLDDDTTPLPLARLLALATQKFISDIAQDAYQYSRMRSGTLTSNTLSAMSNPGAPGPAGGGAATGSSANAAGSGGGAGGSGGAGGAAGAAGKGGPGAHVLGMQRAGFGGGGQGGGQNRTVLTMEDLGMAVGEYGVNVRRPEFYR